MFNIGAGEMVFILVAALLILGPQRLPELARGIGKFLREFRRQTDEVRNVVEREFYAMDQEIGEPPSAPVRPGTRFAPQPPSSLGAPDAPATDGAAPPSDAGSPPDAASPSSSTQVLELDAQGPREVSAADVPAGEPPAAEAAAEVPPEPAAPSATTPTLSPLPGTVARNAPKRS
ncbi:twin-arginine translocase TatA/TatE family subunit [Corallococcus macrosporus]|uniref:Putative twin-arginine translocation protein TatB n=1 Tax=Myxococcus fulvus (strain ATCC BAA-855 / HW-1) TaxID=483219 RepID=F8CLC7_MYXFH|nr:twin-arginine translocase TatA/TatE family subunit [Corallococcus macrosporus]AEI65252.1 putative twin-arginine translocation protein TatB [Corallococcus macrosporus]